MHELETYKKSKQALSINIFTDGEGIELGDRWHLQEEQLDIFW